MTLSQQAATVRSDPVRLARTLLCAYWSDTLPVSVSGLAQRCGLDAPLDESTPRARQAAAEALGRQLLVPGANGPQQATRFAGELLIPTGALHRLFARPGYASVEALATAFAVPEKLVCARLLETNLVPVAPQLRRALHAAMR